LTAPRSNFFGEGERAGQGIIANAPPIALRECLLRARPVRSKRRTKNNFLFSFPLTLPSPARGEGEKAKLFFARPQA
jgi:hypothetical protein